MLAGHYDKTSVLKCSVRTRLHETTLAKLHLFMPNTRVKLIKPLRRGDESNARTQTPPLSPHVLSDSTQHSKRAVKYLLQWYSINLLFCFKQQWSFNVESYRFLRKSKTEPFLAAIPSPYSSWVSYGDIRMNRVSKVLNKGIAIIMQRASEEESQTLGDHAVQVHVCTLQNALIQQMHS